MTARPVLVIAIAAAAACTKTGVIARDQTLISPGVSEEGDEASFLVGSYFTFHAGLFDRCRTEQEKVTRTMYGDEEAKPSYDESYCNERPVQLDATCTGAGCDVRDNRTTDVTVVANAAGALAIEARVVGDDGKVRAEQKLSYPVVVPDELRWHADTAPAGPVDPSGCPEAIASPEEFPNGAVLQFRGKPVRFPRPDSAPPVTAHVCVGRTDAGAPPTCADVAVDDHGAVAVPAADAMNASGHGSYEATVAYGGLTVTCATAFR